MFNPMQSMNAFAAGAQMGSGIRNRQTENAFSQKLGAGDVQGARDYAYKRGNMQLGQDADAMIAQMGEQERAQAAQRAETLARSAMTLKGIADPTQRTQAYMQMMPQLESAGLSAQELQKFNPTDDNALQAIVNQVTPLAELLKAQAPQDLMQVSAGNTVYDPNTRQPVFSAPKESAPAKLQEVTLADGIYTYDPSDPQKTLTKLGNAPAKSPLVSVNNNPFPTKQSLTPFQAKQDEIFAQELAAWNTGGGADAAKQMDQLNAVADALDSGRNDLTGFLIGITPKWALQGLNPDAVDNQELVEEVVQRNLRVVLGAQFTEKEGERLIARAYNSSLDEKINAERLRRLIQQVQQRSSQLENLNEYVLRNGTSAGWNGALTNVDQIINEIEQSGRSAGGPAKGQKRLKFNPATGEFE